MAHWFHRNPLKPTFASKFDLKKVASTDATKRICNELRLRRAKLLEHMESASTELSIIDAEFRSYLALLYGFVFEVVVQPSTAASSPATPEWGNGVDIADEGGDKKNSKLRYLVHFIWGMSMRGSDAL